VKYIVTINNKRYEVEVERGQANIVKIEETAIPKIQTTVSASSPAPAQTPAPAPAPAPTQAPASAQVQTGGEPVNAPMPGTILDVRVSVGQAVKRGDVIFILEAMKMENEITAPVDGVISQIIATKGSAVSTGDPLAVINTGGVK